MLRDDSSSVENTFHSLLPGGFRWGADSDAAANTNDLMNEEIHHKNRRLSSGSHVHSSSSSNKKHKQQQQHNHHQYNYTENQDNNSSSNSWNDCSTALSSKSTTTENSKCIYITENSKCINSNVPYHCYIMSLYIY